MKKKLIAILLAATCALTAGLTGCSGNAATSGTDESKTSDAQSTGDSSKESTGDNTSKNDVVAGFVYIGKINDGGYTQAHDAGRLAVEAMGVKTYYVEDVPETVADTKEAIQTLIDEGCNLIYSNSFGFMEGTDQMAKEHPEIKFAHCSGYMREDNMSTYFGKVYQARYLAGIVAGMKLNEMIANGDITEDQAKMGYVGAYTYAEVMSGYTSFFLGARSVCPSVTMDVTFTGSWYDETAEKEAANKLIEGGCVLISQHADSMGAPTACETAGVPNVSYNGSTEAACPNTFLVSSRVNWEPYFEYAIKCVADGTPIDTDWCGTLETGSVELSDLGAAVADGTAEAVEAAKADLIAGKAHVYDITTFTVDGKTLDSYEADIDTDPDYTPDHEVVSDGYFHESDVAFRSAPYFNVRIDGINLLDEQY